jgi:hypothetical protein
MRYEDNNNGENTRDSGGDHGLSGESKELSIETV